MLGDDLLGFDVIHKSNIHARNASTGGNFAERSRCAAATFHFGVINGLKKGIARPKMTVQVPAPTPASLAMSSRLVSAP